jgi:hypothetical protein
MATDVSQAWKIDSSSSSLATYDFNGLSLVGWVVTHSVSGITMNGVIFNACRGITLNGGSLNGCTIDSSLTSPAITTNNPGNIEDCAFISAGTGHAIEATATGTFAFEGNTFTGYGADGSTDAAFYNNSGGLITLQIPVGGEEPTIRNAGASTTEIETPTQTQTVTISGAVAGTRIQIYDTTADEELYNDTPASFPYTWTDPDEYVADRAIRLRASYVDGVTAKTFIDTNIGTCTNTAPDIAYLVNQEDDAVYIANGLDGSAITGLTIDDNNLLVNIDDTTISWAEIYAYECYWLFTEVGIADESKFIFAVDTANYAFYDFKIKNVSDPTAPLTITGGYGVDGDTGSSIDVIDSTGGTIFSMPDHVVAYATGSALTSAEHAKLFAIPTDVWAATEASVTDGMGQKLKNGANASIASL